MVVDASAGVVAVGFRYGTAQTQEARQREARFVPPMLHYPGPAALSTDEQLATDSMPWHRHVGRVSVRGTLDGNAPGRGGCTRGAVPDAPPEQEPGDGGLYGTGPVRRPGRLEPTRKLLREAVTMGAPLAGVSGPAATDRSSCYARPLLLMVGPLLPAHNGGSGSSSPPTGLSTERDHAD